MNRPLLMFIWTSFAIGLMGMSVLSWKYWFVTTPLILVVVYRKEGYDR